MLALNCGCTLPTWNFNLPVAAAVASLETWSTSHNSEVNISASTKCANPAKEAGKWCGNVELNAGHPAMQLPRRNSPMHLAPRATFLSLSFAVTFIAVGYINVKLVHV